MSETQTPRTDAVANRWCNDELVTDILREWADFACTLAALADLASL